MDHLLMEEACALKPIDISLNPCCSGSSSDGMLWLTPRKTLRSLNPCCSGSSSDGRAFDVLQDILVQVLILVVVDHLLMAWADETEKDIIVLILVVVDHLLMAERRAARNAQTS